MQRFNNDSAHLNQAEDSVSESTRIQGGAVLIDSTCKSDSGSKTDGFSL